MTYDVRDLYGVWVNLDDNSLLELEEGGDFRLTHADDSPVVVEQRINAVNGISGKWTADDGELRLSINLRSMTLSSPSRVMAIGAAMLSFLLRFVKDREVNIGKITHLTGTDLWAEGSQRKITKFRKKS